MCFSCASSTRPAIPIPAELTSRSSPPVRSTCSRDDPLAVLGLRDVRGDRGRAELGARGLDLLGRARGERELEALVAEHPRDREPDARGASGDQRRRARVSTISETRKESVTASRTWAQIPRLLLSPECDGGSPAAVASFRPRSPPGRRSRPPAKQRRAGKNASAYFEAVSTSLTSLAPSGGCAAKYPAARLEELLRGFVPAEAENLLVGLAPVRRRRRLQARRRARARLHARLLPAARRRPGALRPDRGDERAQRRLRDGRLAAARALDRRVPGEPAERDARARSSAPPTSRCARPARSSPAATRSATTSRSTGSRSSAPCTRTASGRRAARGPATRSS